MKTALIAGGTGLIGRQLLDRLLTSGRYSTVTALTRRPLDVSHPKLNVIETDFRDLSLVLAGQKPDDVFCCLGTTMAKAGSREKFYEVDFKYPEALAKVTWELGARQYLLVSALGADKDSSIYYNRVKGEAEAAIRAMDFECIHIFRPSLLLGERREKRPGEDIAKKVYGIFGFMVPEKYKAIDSATVAQAMLMYASRDQRGIFIHESPQLRALEPEQSR